MLSKYGVAKHGLAEGEGQVSAWGWVPPGSSPLSHSSMTSVLFFFFLDVRLHLVDSRHQAAPAGLSLPLPHCLAEEGGQDGTLMVSVVPTGGASGQNRPPSIF